MIPALKTSTFSLYFLSSNISGATYPGVPHLLNSNSSLVNAASPKSANLIYNSSSFALSTRIRFSGLISLCIMPFAWIYSNALNNYLIVFAEFLSEKLPVLMIVSNNSPPRSTFCTK